MTYLYIIHERSTGTYCSSQRFRTFAAEINAAAVFVSRANADKAIKAILKAGKNNSVYSHWVVECEKTKSNPLGTVSYFNGDLDKYIADMIALNDIGQYRHMIEFATEKMKELRLDLEVVEVTLTVV